MRSFEPFCSRSATRLSGPALVRAASRPFVGLARLSLVAACLLTLPGCLVDDPPPFPESKQTPPRLDYHNALPLLDQIIVAHSGDDLPFSIPVASEDAGDGLSALLFMDYSGGRASPIVPGESIPPSTLDETNRMPVTLDWVVPKNVYSPGCHRLTLRVTHISNIDTNIYPGVRDPADLAEAYWWLNLDADPAPGKMLVDCPLASRGTQ